MRSPCSTIPHFSPSKIKWPAEFLEATRTSHSDPTRLEDFRRMDHPLEWERASGSLPGTATWRAARWLMDLVDEKRASLYRGRCPTNGSWFSNSLSGRLAFTCDDDLSFSSINGVCLCIPQSRDVFLSVLFRGVAPRIRLGWAIVILDSRGRRIRILQILLYPGASLKGDCLECDYNHLCREYYVYIEENTDLIIRVINVDICFSTSKIDIYFRKYYKWRKIRIYVNFLFQLFKRCVYNYEIINKSFRYHKNLRGILCPTFFFHIFGIELIHAAENRYRYRGNEREPAPS